MNKAVSVFRGLKFEAYQCPKCRKKFFSEEQTTNIARTLDALRMHEEYQRRIVNIGHSWGLTLPKEVVDFFHLGKKNTKVIIAPNAAKKVIEIRVR